jgi:hypothetical protein
MEAFFMQVAGHDEKSIKRPVWKVLLPILIAMMVFMAATWLGVDIKKDLLESMSLPQWTLALVPWIPYILIVLVIFFTWHLATSFASIRGPIIWIGSVQTDIYAGLWEVRVENIGSGIVKPSALVTDVLDKNGNRLPRIDYGFKAHWRGPQEIVSTMTLAGDKHLMAAILAVDKSDPNSPRLLLWLPEGKIPLLTDPILEKQKEDLIVEVRIDFERIDGDACTVTKKRYYMVSPDASSDNLFRVREMTWFHWLIVWYRRSRSNHR